MSFVLFTAASLAITSVVVSAVAIGSEKTTPTVTPVKPSEPSEPPRTRTSVFVAPNGLDTSNGTFKKPVRTIAKAIDMLVSGGTVTVDAGIYDTDLNPDTVTAHGPLTLNLRTGVELISDGPIGITSNHSVNVMGEFTSLSRQSHGFEMRGEGKLRIFGADSIQGSLSGVYGATEISNVATIRATNQDAPGIRFISGDVILRDCTSVVSDAGSAVMVDDTVASADLSSQLMTSSSDTHPTLSLLAPTIVRYSAIRAPLNVSESAVYVDSTVVLIGCDVNSGTAAIDVQTDGSVYVYSCQVVSTGETVVGDGVYGSINMTTSGIVAGTVTPDFQHLSTVEPELFVGV